MMADNVFEVRRAFQSKCSHNKFIVDESKNLIECGICGEMLNPVWVVAQLANRESRANFRLIELEKLSDAAILKNKCKCKNCGKMTEIVR